MADAFVKMPEAFYESGLKAEAALIEGGQSPHRPPYLCAGCGSVVVFVSKGKRGDKDVQAHFRRAPRTEHAKRCKYNADEVLKIIEARSANLIERKGTRIHLRLPSFISPEGGQSEGLTTGGGGGRKTVQFSTSRETSEAVIATAVRIVRFLSVYGFDQDSVSSFAVVYKGEAIPWNEFCFSNSDSAAYLFDRIEALGEDAMAPYAIFGRVDVKDHRERNGETTFRLLRKTGQPVFVEGTPKQLQIGLRTYGRHHFDQIERGDYFLGLGFWKTLKHQRARTHDLSLWVNQRWQVAGWK